MAEALTLERWRRVKSVFDQLLEVPIGDRQAYLDSTCEGDLAVRKEVERLIGLHSEASTFLEQPLSACAWIAESLKQATVFRAGDVVNHRFQIARFIGAGGMGEVYEAADGAIGGTPVALKTIRSNLAVNPALEAQFRKEVRIARQITHPNACRIYDLFETRVEDPLTGQSRNIVFLTMELLEGESMADRLARKGPLSTGEALPFVRDITRALDAAHRQGVIHGDLKCSNVMLTVSRDGSLKAVLTDFGLAHYEQRRLADTGGSLVAGTPDYMAPEQLEAGEIGLASDIFAFGVVIYEVVTGRRPFEESSTLKGAMRRSRSHPTLPRTHVPAFDARWEAVILKCLARNPAERFASPSEVLAALEAPSRAMQVTRRSALAAGVLGTAGLCDWLWTSGRRAGFSSIAVLPFENSSGDDDLQYFAEGLTGDLVPMLTRFRGLRVVAPTRPQLKGLSGLKNIATALHVTTVLTGNVRKEGTRIRVTAKLTNPTDGMPLWSGSYVEDIKNLVRIRLNLSMEISGALQPRIPKAQLAGMVEPQSANADAYNLYLLGRHYAGYRSDDGLRLAIDYLQQSIGSDPNFAPAYAALSDVYSIRAGQVGCPPSEYVPKAEQAAKRALELDPRSGEAHVALGFAYGRLWDWSGSEREFRSAIQLNPGLAIAHYRYSGLHSVLGRPEMAIAEVQIARGLDPLSPLVNAGYGAFLYRARRYEEAVAHLQETLHTFPDSAAALSDLGQVYDTMGRFTEAIVAHRKALETGPGYYFRYAARLGHALARAGQEAEARTIAGELRDGLGKSHYSPMIVANVHLGLGEADQTFYWYDVAIQQRDPYMEVINVDPMNDPLRGDPRFSDLLRMVGFA